MDSTAKRNGCVPRHGFETALCAGHAASFDRGGFGFKVDLLGPDLIGCLASLALAQLGGVVERGEFGQYQTELLNRGEVPDPDQLLLRAAPPVSDGIEARLPFRWPWREIGKIATFFATIASD